MKMKCLLAATAAACCFASSANAQSVSDTTTLNEVVVTATKVDVKRNNIPLSITVIDREQIRNSSESSLLPVLSHHVPGLFVTQSGITGYGLSTGGGTINVRGVGQGDKVLMLIDGQPQWAGVFGHHLPDFFVASDVERVEVVRGPGSLLYGSNAMGGVVNVMTRRQQTDAMTMNARVMLGSHYTQKYMLNNGFRKGRWSYFASFNHDRTNGHRADSRFHITNGFGKIGYEINRNWNATANVSLAGFNGRNPGSIHEPLIDNTYSALRGTASLSLENKYDKVSGAVRLFHNFGKHKINDGHSPGGAPRDYLFRSSDHNYGVLAYESFALFKRNTFTAGIDYKNWGGRAWNDKFTGPDDVDLVDKTVNETAAYLVMLQGIGSKVDINAGVRFEHNSAFGSEWIPQAGVTYNPISSNSIKFLFSKGFRSPNLRELYMFMPANPALKPESMLNYEVSVGQDFFRGKLFAEVTAFLINAKNMISVTFAGGRPLNINTGKFTNRGIEAEVRWYVLHNLTVHSNYSYLSLGTPVVAAPKHQFFLSATYNPGRFSVNVNMQGIGDLYTHVDSGNPAANRKDTYTMLNAKIAYTFNANRQPIDVFVKGENLTNKKYEISYGFPMPGATVFVGVDVPIMLKKY